jgi:hypothetical protein
MKKNINLIESVWRRLRKPSRATLDAIRSKDARRSQKSHTYSCLLPAASASKKQSVQQQKGKNTK